MEDRPDAVSDLDFEPRTDAICLSQEVPTSDGLQPTSDSAIAAMASILSNIFIEKHEAKSLRSVQRTRHLYDTTRMPLNLSKSSS